jgi:hypothetical protein
MNSPLFCLSSVTLLASLDGGHHSSQEKFQSTEEEEIVPQIHVGMSKLQASPREGE